MKLNNDLKIFLKWIKLDKSSFQVEFNEVNIIRKMV